MSDESKSSTPSPLTLSAGDNNGAVEQKTPATPGGAAFGDSKSSDPVKAKKAKKPKKAKTPKVAAAIGELALKWVRLRRLGKLRRIVEAGLDQGPFARALSATSDKDGAFREVLCGRGELDNGFISQTFGAGVYAELSSAGSAFKSTFHLTANALKESLSQGHWSGSCAVLADAIGRGGAGVVDAVVTAMGELEYQPLRRLAHVANPTEGSPRLFGALCARVVRGIVEHKNRRGLLTRIIDQQPLQSTRCRPREHRCNYELLGALCESNEAAAELGVLLVQRAKRDMDTKEARLRTSRGLTLKQDMLSLSGCAQFIEVTLGRARAAELLRLRDGLLQTPLFSVLDLRERGLAELLIKHGADVRGLSLCGRTPLLHAVYAANGWIQGTVAADIEAMIQAGAGIDALPADPVAAASKSFHPVPDAPAATELKSSAATEFCNAAQRAWQRAHARRNQLQALFETKEPQPTSTLRNMLGVPMRPRSGWDQLMTVEEVEMAQAFNGLHGVHALSALQTLFLGVSPAATPSARSPYFFWDSVCLLLKHGASMEEPVLVFGHDADGSHSWRYTTLWRMFERRIERKQRREWRSKEPLSRSTSSFGEGAKTLFEKLLAARSAQRPRVEAALDETQSALIAELAALQSMLSVRGLRVLIASYVL